MNRSFAVLREIYGLVVDDGTLAAAILVWMAAIWFASDRLGLASGWSAVAFALGLAAILVENAVRKARRA